MSRLYNILFLLLVFVLSAQNDISSQNSSLYEKEVSSGNNTKSALSVRKRVVENNTFLSSSAQALSKYGPGAMATGLLGYFKLTPDFTGSNVSFGYFSNGINSGYIASYSYNFGYDIGKYGQLGIDITASKIGNSRFDETLQLSPNLDWRLNNENFNIQLKIKGPPIVKKTADDR